MITENVSTLKIHKLTQEQYERQLEAGNIDDTALYLTPDEEIDLSAYATVSQLNNMMPRILDSSLYGAELPEAGTKGRIFFKKVSN